MKSIEITLPDNSKKSFPAGVTAQEVADSIGPGLARAVVVAKVNGELKDLNQEINENSDLELFTGNTTEGHDTLLHSTAHLMAQAVKELYPEAKITIGPTIENGFYYDFDLDESFSEASLEKIEQKMKELARSGQKITRNDVSNDSLKFRDSRHMFVGGVPAIVNRISFTGELGYEIYVAPHFQLKLYEEIMEAGKEFNIKPFGGRALMSMRLEKNWGAWTLDYRPDFTAKETGLDTFINWDKDFIGKENAKKDDSSNQLVPLIVQTNDIDVTNNEAVLKKDKSIGYVTSGGFAHYVNKSIAFSYVNKKEIQSDKGIQIEINGDMFNCSIIKEPLYDPTGQKMRS